jgi:hypothetical protein
MLATFVYVISRQPFDQFQSTRFDAVVPGAAPLPLLPFQPVQVADRGVVLASTGILYVVSRSNYTQLSGAGSVPAGSMVGAFDAGSLAGVVACTPTGCGWLRCESSGACTDAGASTAALGHVTALAVLPPHGDVYLHGRTSGLVRLTPGGAAVPFGRGVRGLVTAVAASKSGGADDVAVATELAVYFDLDGASLEFARHELVGAGIDGPPTSLAFVTPSGPAPLRGRVDAVGGVRGGARTAELWIGHRWCLNVIRDGGSVDRVGGDQGLPVANVTHLSSAGDRREHMTRPQPACNVPPHALSAPACAC